MNKAHGQIWFKALNHVRSSTSSAASVSEAVGQFRDHLTSLHSLGQFVAFTEIFRSRLRSELILQLCWPLYLKLEMNVKIKL